MSVLKKALVGLLFLSHFPATAMGIELPATAEMRRELYWLMLNIYWETRNQEEDSALWAVAITTLNRVTDPRFPDTIEAVVKQKGRNSKGVTVCQFSWYCDGKSDMPNVANTIEKAALVRSLLIAREALYAWHNGELNRFTGYALFYHAESVSPNWDYEFLAKVGDHSFFTIPWERR